jgi:hypothetical protein
VARKRMISPEFFTSHAINSLRIDAAMTFAGLWCYADDYGRAEDDVDLIKAAVWPRRRDQSINRIRQHLDDLEQRGLICRYTVNDFALLHCPSWSEHQKLNRPTPSKMPPCPIHEARDYDEFLNASDSAREKYRNVSRLAHESLMSVSRLTHE